jgi:integrase/recombinase XerC
MSARDLIEAYLDYLRTGGSTGRQAAASTLAEYRRTLSVADRELPQGLEAACEDEIKAWCFRDGWSLATQATYYAPLRGFYQWACRPRHPVLLLDPMVDLHQPQRPPGVPRPVTETRVNELLRIARPPFDLWARMAAGMGMRCCEISACDREDVDEQDTMLHGKGGKDRMVPTDPWVWQAVRGLPPGPIARRRDGGRVTAHDITNRASAYFDRAGFDEVTMHRLRHCYGSWLLDGCGNLRVVQELMGHASPATTAVYTRVTSQARRAAVATLPRLGGERVEAAA